MNKFTGVFLKWLIFFAANTYIFYRIFWSNEPFSFEMLQRAFTFPGAFFFILVLLLLMPLNWLLEAFKWRYLLRAINLDISLIDSLKAVLSGVAVGIFTPNRVGEFAGKIVSLDPALRPQGMMLAVFSSLTQLSITVLMAVTAIGVHFNFFRGMDPLVDDKLSAFPELLIYSMVFIALSFLLIYFLYILSRASWAGKKLSDFFSTSRLLGIKRIVNASVLSILRYAVFLVQYWIILYWFGITDSDWKAWILLPAIFFSTSIIPGLMVFPIDVSVRGATSIFFLSAICVDEEAILFASLLIWLVNLAFPATLGSLLLLKRKFKLQDGAA